MAHEGGVGFAGISAQLLTPSAMCFVLDFGFRVWAGLTLVGHGINQFFICAELQARFPACAMRGAGVVGTSTYTSIPNTTVNVMRPKRPS
jgi:hypothetical protein